MIRVETQVVPAAGYMVDCSPLCGQHTNLCTFVMQPTTTTKTIIFYLLLTACHKIVGSTLRSFLEDVVCGIVLMEYGF